MSKKLFKIDYYVLPSYDVSDEVEADERTFYITEDHILDILEQELRNNKEQIEDFYVTKL
jgi:hypothetical protein